MVRKISRDELLNMRKNNQRFTLVDVLGKDSFDKEHIPGAISMPLAELGEKAARLLNKNDTIVVYCGSFDCSASTMAAEKLLKMGYDNVLDYKGGLKDYKEGGLELVGSEGEQEGCSSCGSCCACG